MKQTTLLSLLALPFLTGCATRTDRVSSDIPAYYLYTPAPIYTTARLNPEADPLKARSADLTRDGVVTLEEVIQLQQAGLSDLEMLERLQATGKTFALTPAQRTYLLSHGVSSLVVNRIPGINALRSDDLALNPPQVLSPTGRDPSPPRTSEPLVYSAQEVLSANSPDINNDGLITLNELVSMRLAGMKEADIFERIKATGRRFELSEEQRTYLLNHGFSNSFVYNLANLDVHPGVAPTTGRHYDASSPVRTGETTQMSLQEVRRAATADLDRSGQVSLSEVVALERAGLEDSVILDRLSATGQVFVLTEDHKRYLLEEGVSRYVVDQLPKLNLQRPRGVQPGEIISREPGP